MFEGKRRGSVPSNTSPPWRHPSAEEEIVIQGLPLSAIDFPVLRQHDAYLCTGINSDLGIKLRSSSCDLGNLAGKFPGYWKKPHLHAVMPLQRGALRSITIFGTAPMTGREKSRQLAAL
jgi:hypothetical protein